MCAIYMNVVLCLHTCVIVCMYVCVCVCVCVALVPMDKYSKDRVFSSVFMFLSRNGICKCAWQIQIYVLPHTLGCVWCESFVTK